MSDGRNDDRRGPRDDERREARLRGVRDALTVELPRSRLERLAASLVERHRTRRRRRALAALAGATSAAALVALLAERQRPLVQLVEAPAETAPAFPAVRPVLDNAEAIAAVTAKGAPAASRGLTDLAADPLAAERWATFVRSPDTSVALPNVSYAGYHFGSHAADGAARPGPVVNVRSAPFGAVGDGVADDSAALRRALDSVERTGGVVYLPDGDYKVNGLLFVHGDGTVLRGESEARTRLIFTQPLDQALGASPVGPYSRWEWAGGLLWFAPRARQSYPTDGVRPRPHFDWARQGWPLGPTLAKVAEPAGRGDRTLVVSETAALTAGELVFVVVPSSETLTAAGWRPEPEAGLLDDQRRKGPAVVRWPVEIASVQGNIVTLAQPLRFDVGTAYEGRGPYLQALPRGSLIRDVGVERLTLVMQRPRDNHGWRTLGLSQSFGWNGIFFLNTHHGFARQVTVVNGDLGMGTVSSKNVSLEEIALRADGMPPGLPAQRALSLRALSHDVLVDRIYMDPLWQGARLEGTGFVVSRGHGRFGQLNGQAVDSVLTEITEIGEGPPGSHGSAVPGGERVVGWNLRPSASADGSGARPSLETMPVPRNLYDGQKRLRLPDRQRRR